jgi:carbonic anhydrase
MVTLALLLATSCAHTKHDDHDATQPLTSNDALKRLTDGNQRFAAHEVTHPEQTPQRRAEIAGGQHPFAIVLSCADSRVPPELIFDQGLGDLFVVRVAGNTADDVALGSIEYAVEHLHVPLIIVLGHEKCGAVQAALAGKPEPGHIMSVASPIEPVLPEARQMSGDALHNAVVLNARHVADQLRRSEPVLKKHFDAGEVGIISAVYELDSGRVVLDTQPGGAEK